MPEPLSLEKQLLPDLKADFEEMWRQIRLAEGQPDLVGSIPEGQSGYLFHRTADKAEYIAKRRPEANADA